MSDKWIEESNKRIDEIRKVAVEIQTHFDRDVTVEVTQTAHAYPFGSAIDASLFSSDFTKKCFFYTIIQCIDLLIAFSDNYVIGRFDIGA